MRVLPFDVPHVGRFFDVGCAWCIAVIAYFEVGVTRNVSDAGSNYLINDNALYYYCLGVDICLFHLTFTI